MADPTPLITQSGPVQVATPADPVTPIITQSGAVQITVPPTPTTPIIAQSGSVQVATPADPVTPIITQSGAVQVTTPIVNIPRALTKAPGAPRPAGTVAPSVLGRMLGVDLRAGGLFVLYGADTGNIGRVSYVMVVCKTATGVTTLPTARVITGANVVFPAQELIGLDVVNKVWIWPIGVGTSKAIQPGQLVELEIVTPSTATSHTADIFVYGYEV